VTVSIADDVATCAVERAQLEIDGLCKQMGRMLVDLEKKRNRVIALEARIAELRKGIGESEGDGR
jgi:hypothetical protein